MGGNFPDPEETDLCRPNPSIKKITQPERVWTFWPRLVTKAAKVVSELTKHIFSRFWHVIVSPLAWMLSSTGALPTLIESFALLTMSSKISLKTSTQLFMTSGRIIWAWSEWTSSQKRLLTTHIVRTLFVQERTVSKLPTSLPIP